MVMQFDVIRFVKDATNVDGATQVVPLSIDPRAVILVSDGNTLSNTISDHYQFIYGMSDGVNHASISYTSDDADAAADAAGIHRNDAIFSRLDEVDNATEVARASCRFGNKSITFTWTVNDAVASLITLYVFGGDDITKVKVATTTVGSAGTGTKNYTGLGFNPRGEFHSLLGIISSGLTTANTVSSAAVLNVGFSANPTNKPGGNNEAGMSNSIEDAATTMDTYSSISGGLSILIPNTTTGAITTSAQHLDWIPDGFSMNYTANAGATIIFSYLVIEGGTYFMNIPSTPTTPQRSTIVNGASVQTNLRIPRGLMIFTNGHTAGGSTAHAKVSFGGTDGVRTACIATIDEDNVADSDSYRVNAYNDGAVFKTLSITGTLESNANFIGFVGNPTADIILDYTVIAAARLLLVLEICDEFPFPLSQSYGKINPMFDNNLGPTRFG